MRKLLVTRRSHRHALTVLVVLLALLPACRRSGAADTVDVITSSGKKVPVTVELATTPDTRQLGLMYREHLAPGSGMLFIFPDVAPQSFWMHNTKIPLDIVFIDDGGKIVRLYANTTPFSDDSLPSEAPVRYVLEVPGGFCAANDIRPGDEVEVGRLATVTVR
jgi:uncharacterized membrane protein (UPF0127 family)